MVFLWLPAAVFQSQDPIVTDRPDFTESAVVVPLRTTQIEGGLTHTSARPATNTSGPELLIRRSLGPNLEGRVALPDYNIVHSGGQTERGFGDATLGVKIQLGPLKNGTDVGVILESSVPTGGDAFTSDIWEPGFKLCASRELCPGTSLSGMIAGSIVGRDRIGAWQATLSLGKSLTERSGLFLEYAVNFAPRTNPQHFVHSGFVYQPCATSQWDVHFGFDMVNPRSTAFIGFGYGVRF